MLKVVKVRIYPDTSQKVLLAKAFGSYRWVWNHFLNLINETYKATEKRLSSYDVKKLLPELKKKRRNCLVDRNLFPMFTASLFKFGSRF